MRRRRATSTSCPRDRRSRRRATSPGSRRRFAFDVRELGATERQEDGTFASTRRCWFRVREPLPDDPAVHACLLAYFSDMTGAAFRPGSMGAWGTHTDTSLDHAVWFHRPWRADVWSVFDLQALVNAGGRATIRATMRGDDGTLHLSMAQELLIRAPRRAAPPRAAAVGEPGRTRDPGRERWAYLTVSERS